MLVSSGIDYMLKAHLFGDLFARDILTYPEREIATISALASMNGTESQLFIPSKYWYQCRT